MATNIVVLFLYKLNIVYLQTHLLKRLNFKLFKTTVNNYNFYILITKLKNKIYRYAFIKFLIIFYTKSDRNQKITNKLNDIINSHSNNEFFLFSLIL